MLELPQWLSGGCKKMKLKNKVVLGWAILFGCGLFLAGLEIRLRETGKMRIYINHWKTHEGMVPVQISCGDLNCSFFMDETGDVFEFQNKIANKQNALFRIDIPGQRLILKKQLQIPFALIDDDYRRSCLAVTASGPLIEIAVDEHQRMGRLFLFAGNVDAGPAGLEIVNRSHQETDFVVYGRNIRTAQPLRYSHRLQRIVKSKITNEVRELNGMRPENRGERP